MIPLYHFPVKNGKSRMAGLVTPCAPGAPGAASRRRGVVASWRISTPSLAIDGMQGVAHLARQQTIRPIITKTWYKLNLRRLACPAIFSRRRFVLGHDRAQHLCERHRLLEIEPDITIRLRHRRRHLPPQGTPVLDQNILRSQARIHPVGPGADNLVTPAGRRTLNELLHQPAFAILIFALVTKPLGGMIPLLHQMLQAISPADRRLTTDAATALRHLAQLPLPLLLRHPPRC